jgi:hypothetical protein
MSFQTTEALTRYAGTNPKPFTLMHCWKHLKDEPKWQELLSEQSKPINVEEDCYETPTRSSNQVDTPGESCMPSSGRGKRPLGRDASKESRKKSASSSSSESYVSKMQDLLVDRMGMVKDTQAEKNRILAQMAEIEKEKMKRQVELEERRLALEDRRLAKEEREGETRILAEEERILSIDLTTCNPALRVFYKAQQAKILAKYSDKTP